MCTAGTPPRDSNYRKRDGGRTGASGERTATVPSKEAGVKRMDKKGEGPNWPNVKTACKSKNPAKGGQGFKILGRTL